MSRPTFLPLFDARASEESKQAALDAVAAHTRAWTARALEQLHQVALTQPLLTSDDVWARLDTAPQEPRAMGVVMVQARKRGWIQPTDRFVQTSKVSQHRQPIRTWQSEVYRDAAL